MDLHPVFLSRLQFAFVIGHAAWLATMEACVWATGNPIYRRVFVCDRPRRHEMGGRV